MFEFLIDFSTQSVCVCGSWAFFLNKYSGYCLQWLRCDQHLFNFFSWRDFHGLAVFFNPNFEIDLPFLPLCCIHRQIQLWVFLYRITCMCRRELNPSTIETLKRRYACVYNSISSLSLDCQKFASTFEGIALLFWFCFASLWCYIIRFELRLWNNICFV